MFKRIVSLAVMAVMVFALSACNGGNALAKYKKEAKSDLEIYATEKGEENYSEENWAEILQLLEEGKAAIDEAKDDAEVDTAVKDATDMIDAVLTKEPELVIYKENAKAALEAYVDEQGEANYSWAYWEIILQLLEDGKTAIAEAEDKAGVDFAVNATKTAIDDVESTEDVMEYFSLTILEDEITVLAGEDFRVNVELKNQSGKDWEIGWDLGFITHIPGYIDYWAPGGPVVDLPESQSVFIENGGVLRNIGFWGDKEDDGIWFYKGLETGVYELSFHFRFGFNWHGIRIWSNTITLTVL